MLQESSSAGSSSTLRGTTTDVIPNLPPPESPSSMRRATPTSRPVNTAGLGIHEEMFELRLDDIQSTVPLSDFEEGDEVSTTIAFPQENALSQVPSVTITTSHDNLSVPPTPIINTPPPNATETTIPSMVPFLHLNALNPSASTISSAASERDRLADLPVSFSVPRMQIQGFLKSTEMPGIPAQDSISSSLKGQTSRRRESVHSVGSRGEGTLKRVSFDGDRPSFSSLLRHGILSASPSLEGRNEDAARTPQNGKPNSPPRRSTSPFRNFLWPLHRSHSREEPFVPVDPYKLNVNLTVPYTVRHIISQIICQLYRHLLLRLPSIYFSRVSRVFESAEVSKPEVQRMIEGRNNGEAYRWPADHEWVAPNVSPALIRFKESWESFVESVSKEWKTLNVVSALLMTCVFLLPIYGRENPEIVGAPTAPVIRTTAFLSLICALMSLVYGCVYILRFGTMKSMYRASKWAEEAQHGSSILWNVWVLLAMPAVWISWSMIFFCVCILVFVWDQPFPSSSSSSGVPHQLTESGPTPEALEAHYLYDDRVAIASRVIISIVFALGLIYFIFVVRTFRSWGDKRVSQVVRESLEAGKWTPRTPSPTSPPLRRESRFTAQKPMDLGDDEKPGMRRMHGGRSRAHSVDSAMV